MSATLAGVAFFWSVMIAQYASAASMRICPAEFMSTAADSMYFLLLSMRAMVSSKSTADGAR